MQDSNLNQSRLDDLINTISEAKRSLNNWQDRRTEALIRLDAFTYDIQRIGEEKKKSVEAIAELKNEIAAQAKIYQSHVNDLTDDMQLLKLENENLRNEVLERNLSIDAMAKEVENQSLIREQQINIGVAKLNEVRAEMEARISEVRNETEARADQEIQEYHSQNEFLNAKVVEMARQKSEIEMRAERLEREIVQIRSHMLNVLEVNQTGLGSGNKAKYETSASKPRGFTEAPLPAAYDSQQPGSKPTPGTEISMADVKKLRAVEIEPDSVDEYLKRLGY